MVGGLSLGSIFTKESPTPGNTPLCAKCKRLGLKKKKKKVVC